MISGRFELRGDLVEGGVGNFVGPHSRRSLNLLCQKFGNVDKGCPVESFRAFLTVPEASRDRVLACEANKSDLIRRMPSPYEAAEGVPAQSCE